MCIRDSEVIDLYGRPKSRSNALIIAIYTAASECSSAKFRTNPFKLVGRIVSVAQ